MKKKLFKIQVAQTIFFLILFSIAILEKNGVMQREQSFMLFYVILCMVFWIIMTIVLIIMMHKNKNKEKKLFITLVILSIEILILGVFCGNVDRRIDMIEFTKHCEKTTAIVYDIEKDMRIESVGTEQYRGILTYKYCLEYYVNRSRYTTYITESNRGSPRDDMLKAEVNVEIIDPKYEIGDEFTIYYNTEDPNDCRKNIGYASQTTLNIFAAIIIGLRVLILSKYIIDYNKEKIDLE